jgi:glycerol-3-phosphate dehydrogenase (NAD(P)+)
MAVVTILGAGVMGSAMSLPAADRGHQVRLVGTHLDGEIVAAVAAGRPHPRLGVVPPVASVHCHDAFRSALGADTDLIVLGVSSAGIPWAIERLSEALRRPIPVLMITKGLQPVGDAIEVLPHVVRKAVKARTGHSLDVAAVGGPCIAGELAARRETGVVVTSEVEGLPEMLCHMLETPYYQPRPSADVVGVEVCAAFKNFFAIAVGWAAGQLERNGRGDNGALMHNPASIVFTEAIVEMLALVRHLGGREDSVWGLPGAGDLYVTCQAGRNSRLGKHLGLGATYEEVRNGPMRGETIEGAELGIALAATLRRLIARGALAAAEVPLLTALLDTLTEGRPLDIPWRDLHRRPPPLAGVAR